MQAPQQDPVGFKLEDMLIANYGESAKLILGFDRFREWSFTHAEFALRTDGRTYLTCDEGRALVAFRNIGRGGVRSPSVYLVFDDRAGTTWDARQQELQKQIETDKASLTKNDWFDWNRGRPTPALRLVAIR